MNLSCFLPKSRLLNPASTLMNDIDWLGKSFDLLHKGWSVIPVSIDKRPLVDWKKYQIEKPGEADLFEWFGSRFLDKANIGIITGKVSGIVVVDVDPRHGGNNEKFKDLGTLAVKTGGGGWHYYFRYEDGLQNQAGIQPGIDIRAEGGYIVVPPSVHPSGNTYEWIGDPETTPILPIPEFIKEWIKKDKSSVSNSKWSPGVLDGVGEGVRNESAASVAGKLISRFKKDEWESEAWKFLKSWNDKNNPPLPEEELRQVFESICRKELSKTQQIKEQTNNTVTLEEALEAVEAVLPGKKDLMLLAMATSISHFIDKKTPLWMMFVGVPSSAKTEIARMIESAGWVFFLDSLTENAFVSGMKGSIDLLPELNRKCLVVKDFTTTLSQKEETVKKILGDLTSIYDDSYVKHSPVRGTVEYHAFFSLLGCVTPQILNRHQRYMNQIGPRFLFYRVPNSSQEEVERSFEVLWSGGDTQQKIKFAHDLVCGYCKQLCDKLNEIVITRESPEIIDLLDDLAVFTSQARGMVLTRSAEFINAENEKVQFYEPVEIQVEEPFRALQQLRVLARALAVIQGRVTVQTEDMRLVKQVALSSMPADRSLLLSVIRTKNIPWTAKQIADEIGISHKTAVRQLDELVTLKILTKYGKNGVANEYVISTKFQKLFYGGEEFVSRSGDKGTGTETPQDI